MSEELSYVLRLPQILWPLPLLCFSAPLGCRCEASVGAMVISHAGMVVLTAQKVLLHVSQDCLGRSSNFGQSLQHTNHSIATERGIRFNGQAFPGKAVQNSQNLKLHPGIRVEVLDIIAAHTRKE